MLKTNSILYFDTDRDQGETPFIPLDTFKSLMELEETDYPVYKVLNQSFIKSAIREINDLTNYRVKIDRKRIRRRIGELKFRIRRIKHITIQESFFHDIENLPPVAVELVQADIDWKVALRIVEQA